MGGFGQGKSRMSDLLQRRVRHYSASYTGERLRQRLLDDGFDLAAIDAAISAIEDPGGVDAYGAATPGPAGKAAADPVAVFAIAVLASFGTGIAPWLLFLGFDLHLLLVFAWLGAGAGVNLWVLVRYRWDYPGLAIGFGWGIPGGIFCFFTMIAVVFFLLAAV